MSRSQELIDDVDPEAVEDEEGEEGRHEGEGEFRRGGGCFFFFFC